MSLHFHHWGEWRTLARHGFTDPDFGGVWYVAYQSRRCDICGTERLRQRKS